MSIIDKAFWEPVVLKVFDSNTYCDIIPFVGMPGYSRLINYEDLSITL